METFKTSQIQKIKKSNFSDLLNIDAIEKSLNSQLPEFNFEYEADYFSENIELYNDPKEDYLLIIDYDIKNNLIYNDGDYWNPPSSDGELKINVNSVILSNYEDSDQSFDIIDSKWIKELEEKIWYFYNS